jgi:hypothetical protein
LRKLSSPVIKLLLTQYLISAKTPNQPTVPDTLFAEVRFQVNEPRVTF